MWQVLVYKTTIWGSTSRQYVPKEDKLFSEMAYAFGTAADILIAGFDPDSRDHDV